MASLIGVSSVRAGLSSTASTARISKRFAHDLIINKSPRSSSTKAILKHGPPTGGRSAASGHTVTVFGCTGFLGRYLVHKLGKSGTQVIVPYRDEDDKRHLKVMGDLGQIVPLEWDLRNPQQIEECIRHSDAVYNLTGRDYETRNFSYEDVNVTGPGLIARIASDLQIPRLIHLSHLNASPTSESAFYRTKYEGEVKVREEFPDATIVRPGALFGGEDWLLNAIASYPTLYHLNNGQTRIQPAHVLDVAEALAVMLGAPKTSTASTFMLPGPRTYTFSNLIRLVEAFTLKSHAAPFLPKQVALLIANVLNRGLWWPTVSPDEVVRKYIDDVTAGVKDVVTDAPAGWASDSGSGLESFKGVNGEPVKSWADLNIEPETVEEHAIKYLRRYRTAATFDAPVEMGTFKAPKTYHVVE